MSKKPRGSSMVWWVLGAVVVAVGYVIANVDPVAGLIALGAGIVFLIWGRSAWKENWKAGRVVVQPVPEAPAFSGPPPPDTVLVECNFCGTIQPFKQTCVRCGAPLPRP
jgi:hypothetical protein